MQWQLIVVVDGGSVKSIALVKLTMCQWRATHTIIYGHYKLDMMG